MDLSTGFPRSSDPDGDIKTTFTALAEKRKSSHLLELTGLLTMLQTKYIEAVDLFDHAEALATSPAARARGWRGAKALDGDGAALVEALPHLPEGPNAHLTIGLIRY